ncbi:PAS domain-containing sensor histidine kinase [Herbiconiux sp. CPCC 205763]|uniref:histidine kinase n=1 Tax=Herbiconiux aconitum TaxID=2970913 RepID=A0ABT2GMI1_9MICO|nr:PAS domain-containing sensor histidine kinase [Herbiconiux aconitum]MCS5716792.1 PAS domain-containing sensor histidine kinase [Herbiconiux aconitum]
MSPGSVVVEADRRSRVDRAVFQSQLLLAAALLLLVCAAFVFQPGSVLDVRFFGGVAVVFVLTGAAAIVPWSTLPHYWIALLPIIDIFAIVAVRQGNSVLGAGLLLVFPVIWLAGYFGLRGAVTSVVTSSTLLWLSALLNGEPLTLNSIPGLLLLPVTLTFIATTTLLTSSRTSAQRGLLRQQADLLEVALRRARRQEQTLDEVLNAVTFGVVAFGKDGVESIVNRAHRNFQTQFGQPESSVEPPVLYKPDRTTPYLPEERPFRRATGGERFDDVVVWLGEPGEHRVALSVSSRPLTAPDGELDGGVMVSRDVTAEINAIQARDDLVASVSHELRTPLTSILGYLELALDDEGLDASTRSMLEVASSNADRLLALVADLLTAASEKDQQIVMSFNQCDLAEIAVQSIEAQRLSASDRGISIENSIAEPVLLEADGFRLRQVMDNLISNAIKYNRENGHVSVSTRSSASHVDLIVSDTGIGLSDLEQTKLFDRYFRAEGVRQSTIHGSGLGLTISRDIVRRHGGDLVVTSALGVGTSFTASIPRAR